MKTLHFYSVTTGQFLGRTLSMQVPNLNIAAVLSGPIASSPDELIQQNTPAGHKAIEGQFDHLSQRVDLAVHAQLETLRAENAQHDAGIKAAMLDLSPNMTSTDGGIAQQFRQQREADIAALKDKKTQLQASIDALLPSLVIDYVPPAPSPEHEWNPDTKRWQLTGAVQARNAASAQARSQIAALEQQQARPLRELAIDWTNMEARRRLNEIDAQIAALRPAFVGP